MACLATRYIILQIYIQIRRNLHMTNVYYELLNLTWTLQVPCKTRAKLKRTTPKSWPDHGGSVPAQYRIHMSNREGMAPYDKAWRTLATACFPCVLQCFLAFTLSESCASHGFLSLRITFTVRLTCKHPEAWTPPFWAIVQSTPRTGPPPFWIIFESTPRTGPPPSCVIQY
jgi:hypothetical protein